MSSGLKLIARMGEDLNFKETLSFALQEAGWLTGIKESEWLQYRDANSYKGLFPENFTRRLE